MGATSPGRWQPWQFFCRIGRTSLSKVTEFGEWDWASATIPVSQAGRNRRSICSDASLTSRSFVEIISLAPARGKGCHREISDAREPLLGRMDPPVSNEPPEPGKPGVSHDWDPDDRGLAAIGAAGGLARRKVVAAGDSVRGGLGVSIRRSRLRTQTARISQRLAVPTGRREVVGR